MRYAEILSKLPEDIRWTMLEFAESMEEDMRAQLAVREEVVRLNGTVQRVIAGQERTESRLDRAEAILAELLEAEKRTDRRLEELAEAQARTEQRVDALAVSLDRLAEAQARTEQRLEALAEAQARTEQRLEALAEAQARTEQRLEALAEAQARTEQRLDALAEAQARTEQRLEALAEAQAHTEQRVDALALSLDRLAEAQARTEQRLDALEQAHEQTARHLQEVAKTLRENSLQLASLSNAIAEHNRRLEWLESKTSQALGYMLEVRYRDRAASYFGKLLRKVRVVTVPAIEDRLEKHLTDEEIGDLHLLDLMIRGKPRHLPGVDELWLAVEISSVVDGGDIERAVRRAALLRKAGLDAIAAVAGNSSTEGARKLAAGEGVALFQDGTVSFWEEALRHAGLE
ncbi:MAG: hypothetical protein D6775_05195 [Caldilineae bacterium]|nr:MAG: hypothetical protein D6775_05195 [Caldilineae bacterium]